LSPCHSSSILLTFGAALAIDTELNKGLPDFVFGSILCFVNVLVLGLAVAMGARRNEKETKRRMWRQVKKSLGSALEGLEL